MLVSLKMRDVFAFLMLDSRGELLVFGAAWSGTVWATIVDGYPQEALVTVAVKSASHFPLKHGYLS